MSHFTLFLNKNVDKTDFDRIAVYKKDNGFTAYYKANVTMETYEDKTPVVIRLETHHDLLEYLEDMMDLLYFDVDTNPCPSVDLGIAEYPIVALHPRVTSTKDLIIRVVRAWAKR